MKEGGIVRRLFDMSVSILMAAVLLMSQSWTVTAAYADYSVNGSTNSTNLNSEDSNAIDDGSDSEGHELNASPVVNESQDTQQGSSEGRSEVVADDSVVSNQLTVKNVTVSAHVQNIGWMDPVSSGKVAGTTGRGLNLEALKISLEVDGTASQEQLANAISVEAHVSNVGWQPAVGNGGTAGTTGQSRAVEALRVRLSGELSARYTVWYRVHSAEFGWLGWACDGADAGLAGYGRAVQAVQVAVLPKGDPAPGDTSTPFVDRSSEPPSVSYSAHVSGVGWQDEVSGGAVAGTTGQGRAVECVKMRLTGGLSEYYDVWYRAYVQDYGWLGWASDGARAGTTGIGYRVEALQVRILAKGSAAPGPTVDWLH